MAIFNSKLFNCQRVTTDQQTSHQKHQEPQQEKPLQRRLSRLLRADMIELREQGVVTAEVRLKGHATQNAHGDVA